VTARTWNIVIGAGLFAALVVLTNAVTRSVLEVLAVERDRRKMSGGVERAHDTPPVPSLDVPPPDLFAETVRRVHWDICDEWDRP